MKSGSIILFPLLASVIFILLALAIRDRLPDPLAIHFGISGQADGYLSFWPSVITNAALIATPAFVGLFLASTGYPKRLRGIFFWLPMSLTGLFFAISSYLLLIQIDLETAEVAKIDANFFLLIFLPVFFLTLLLLRLPEIEVDDSYLNIKSLGISMVKISLDQIASVSTTNVRARDFGGWGLRVNFQGEIAFLPSSGSAIAIEKRSGEKILIRTNNPEQMKTMIEGKLS